jgi:hypothetical protein
MSLGMMGSTRQTGERMRVEAFTALVAEVKAAPSDRYRLIKHVVDAAVNLSDKSKDTFRGQCNRVTHPRVLLIFDDALRFSEQVIAERIIKVPAMHTVQHVLLDVCKRIKDKSWKPPEQVLNDLKAAAKITAERTLIATESALATEKAGRERGERLLREAQATIRELQARLDTAVHGLQAMQVELAAERQARQMAEETIRAAVTTTPAEVRGEAAPVVRRPVGRPRTNIVAQPRGRKASAKAPAPRKAVPKKPVSRKQSPVPTVRRPVGRPRKKMVAQSAQRPAKSSAKAAAPTKTAPKKVGKPARKVSAKAGRPIQARKPKPIKSWRNGR